MPWVWFDFPEEWEHPAEAVHRQELHEELDGPGDDEDGEWDEEVEDEAV